MHYIVVRPLHPRALTKRRSCHRAEFLAAHDRTQNGMEEMASRCAEFIAARDLTTMREEFEDAKDEWVVEQEAAKAAQRERKSQKALKKREARRRKKEKDAALPRRGRRRSKHGGVSPTKSGRRTTASGQHVRSSSTSS